MDLIEARINKSKISGRAWGDVDKSALGRRLAEMYAAGRVTRAQIREVYAYTPDEAFGRDANDKPVFERSKAWGPHHELQGDEIVLNRNGVHSAAQALAGARSEPKLSNEALTAAKRHIRRHYRDLKEEVPDALKENKKIQRGQPLEELVKGSMEYTRYRIYIAFRRQFPMEEEGPYFRIEETFADYVIVWSSDLPVDEYYRVPYRREAEEFIFAPRNEWEVVELAYRPKTMAERRVQSDRLVERVIGSLELVEAKKAEKNPDGPWRIKGRGVTADIVNGNDRRYPAEVLEAAVRDIRTHLQESAGQGRLVLSGEADHPRDKGNRTPLLQETIINWDTVEFDGKHVLLEGWLLATSKGRDVRAIMLGGVKPDISQRGYGQSIFIDEKGRSVEEVFDLTLTGYDLVANGSDPDGAVTDLQESEQDDDPATKTTKTRKEQKTMDPELQKAIAEFIEAHIARLDYAEAIKGQIKKAVMAAQPESVEAAKGLIETRVKEYDAVLAGADAQNQEILAAAGVSSPAELVSALQENRQEREAEQKELADLREKENKRQVAEFIEGQIGEFKYPTWLRSQFIEAVKGAEPKTVDEAKTLIAGKRKEYDGIMANLTLAARGMNIDVLGPVLESETGVPEFARVAHELNEALVQTGRGRQWDPRNPQTVNQRFTIQYMERFDKRFRRQLMAEARDYQEAEQTSDLNLPYSVSRAVIAQALPMLVAIGVFDVGMMDSSPTHIFYEEYTGESGSSASVSDEDVTADSDAWAALDYKRLRPGTVVVTNEAGDTTYTEGDDYVIDYANGRLMALSGGNIIDAQALKVDYTYDAIRKGEMQKIERGKVQLTSKVITAAADRLATQISKEAIVFSRSQLSWDAVTRTLMALVKEIQRKIDGGMFYMALAAALQVADNSGGTWNSAANPVSRLVEYVGYARVKIAKRYYEPTGLLLSVANSDIIANWEGFSAAGERPDADLRAEGYVGRLKGLPCFETTEFSDSYVLPVNREVVMHRIYEPMAIYGPFPSYDSDGKLIAADQYYAEEFNATDAPVPQKAAWVGII